LTESLVFGRKNVSFGRLCGGVALGFRRRVLLFGNRIALGLLLRRFGAGRAHNCSELHTFFDIAAGQFTYPAAAAACAAGISDRFTGFPI
jgi:hypothetical protein